MDDNYEKQVAEPIPQSYFTTEGEFGGGCASICGERWHRSEWQYCRNLTLCKAGKKKVKNS